MKSKNKVLHKDDWEAIIAQPNSISKLTLGKLFLLNKKFIKDKYEFSHVKGNVEKSLKFYKEVVIPQEFGDIALEESKIVSHEIGVEKMNETDNNNYTVIEDITESEVVQMNESFEVVAEAEDDGKDTKASGVESMNKTDNKNSTVIEDITGPEVVQMNESSEVVAEAEDNGKDTKMSQVYTSGMFNMKELKNSLEGIVLQLGGNLDDKKRKVSDAQLAEIMKFTSLFDYNGFHSVSDYAEMMQFACDAYKQGKFVKQSRTPFSLLLLLVKTVVVKSIHDEQNRLKEEHLQIRVNTMKDLIEAEVSKDTSLLQSNSTEIELYVRTFASVNFAFAFFETSYGPIKFKQLFGGDLKRSVKTAQKNCKDLKYVEGNKVLVGLLQKLHVLQDATDANVE